MGKPRGKGYPRGGGKSRGAPRGGDGQGDFKGTAMSAYRTQPLPEILSGPGVTVTCVQGKEVIAEREAIDALETAADEVYGPLDNDVDEEDGDIEDMLKRELESLNSKPGKSPRFRVCKRESACREYILDLLIEVVYIVVLKPLDPSKLVAHIMDKCETSARCSFRFVQRLMPITAVSNANLDKLAQLAAGVLPAVFDAPGLKFAIQPTTRNSTALDRLDMIKTVAEEVGKLSPEHKVDLKNADVTVLVELHRHSIGISAVRDFDKYKKFNPALVARDAAKAAEGTGEVGRVESAKETGKTTGQARAENRVRRAEGIKAAQGVETAQSTDTTPESSDRPQKRKAEDEDGEVSRTAGDVETGEVVEDEAAQLGDEFDEIIENGRAVKVRRQE